MLTGLIRGPAANSLVAIGDEDGSVRLLESAKDGKPTFNTAYVAFKAHGNAVMDLAFSSDDQYLATASGDQMAKIIDMPTQTAVYVLAAEHTSSLKQVAFQPGNDNIIATCSRDSVVALWDLRCNGSNPVVKVATGDSASEDELTFKVKYPSKVQSIVRGHSDDRPM